MFKKNNAQNQGKDSFLYKGIRNGFITVEDSGAMAYNVKELVRSPEGKTRLKRAIISTSADHEQKGRS